MSVAKMAWCYKVGRTYRAVRIEGAKFPDKVLQRSILMHLKSMRHGLNDKPNVKEIHAEFEYFYTLFCRANSGDKSAITKLVKKAYSFLHSYKGPVAKNALDVDVWKIVPTIPKTFRVKVPIPKYIDPKNAVGVNLILVKYLKALLSEMQSETIKEIYLEVLKGTPVLCPVHSKYKVSDEFPLDTKLFDKEAIADNSENVVEKLKSDIESPKYTFEYLTKMHVVV